MLFIEITVLCSSPHLDTFMRVMGDRPYPVAETFVTSAGRRTHPPPRQENESQQPTQHELASRRIKELSSYMNETCMFRSTAIDAAALEAALKERSENKVGGAAELPKAASLSATHLLALKAIRRAFIVRLFSSLALLHVFLPPWSVAWAVRGRGCIPKWEVSAIPGVLHAAFM